MRLPLILALFAATPAVAQNFTLVDGNSRAGITARNGMTTWFIDGGRDNVFLSNYYLRIGSGLLDLPLSEAIGAPVAEQPQLNQLALDFTGSGVNANLAYRLTGGAPGSARSRIEKSLTLTNTSAGPLAFSLFDYTDFDIRFAQASQRDQSVLNAPNRILTTNAVQPLRIATRVSPHPDHHEISDFFTLYTRFFIDLDGPTTLPDTPGLGVPFPAVASDNAFAFQWNAVLAAGETFNVGHRSQFAAVPAPGTGAGMLALFSAVLLAARRRRGLAA